MSAAGPHTTSNAAGSSSPLRRVALWVIALAVGAAYVVDLARNAPGALQDLPNHLARVAIIDDLVFHGGREFGQAFEFHFMAVPYFLHDALFAAATEFLGIHAGAVAWLILVFLSVPCALVIYSRVAGLSGADRPLLFLIGLYIATNAAFCRGFLAYCLALSGTLLAFAAAQSWRERGTAAAFAGYCVALCVGYFIHLTALVFIAAAVAVSAALRLLRRELRVGTELALLIPIVVLLLWHLAQGNSGGAPGLLEWSAYSWGGLPAKLSHLDWAFIRFDRRNDHRLLGLGLLCLAGLAWTYRLRESQDRAYRCDMLVLAATFLALYLAIPSSVGVLSWLDVRALPMIAVFLALALVPRSSVAGRGSITQSNVAPLAASAQVAVSTYVPFALVLALAVANLVCLHHYMARFGGWLSRYREIVAVVPAGAWVFPIYTNTWDRPVKSTLHACAHTILDRRALNPYLFSRDQGEPMPYFAYRHRPYAPDEDWYLGPVAQRIDWGAIAASYSYLLVTEPYDPARIALETTTVAQNSAAALLRIGPRAASHPDGRAASAIPVIGSRKPAP